MTSKEAPSTLVPLSTVTTSNPSTDSLNRPNTATQQPSTYDPTSTDPFSPFYSHARASESSRRLHKQSSSVSHPNNPNGHDQYDLEKALPVTVTETHKSSTLSTNDANKPSLLCQCSAKKTGGRWRNMSKKQRMWVRVLVVLLFVGAVTGLGLGVSKAMGTGIWKEGGTSAALEER
ncbi:MAG: hypothetical protein Q9208_003921 [Pyrenodesmia sp. 3 TL-2023]